MKKITKKQRDSIILLNIKLRNTKKSVRGKRTKVTGENWFNNNFDIINILDNDKDCSINFPKMFNFSQNYDESARAIIAIRKILSLKNARYKLKSIKLDLINEISTSASLVLTAEIDKWNKAVGRKLIPETDKWQSNVKQHMTKLGFFELCRFNNTDYSDNQESAPLEIVKFLKGACKDVDKAKLLREKIEELVGSRIKRPPLFQALSEAITNVTHHAYPEKQKNNKFWYMTASFCSTKRELKVAFYDQGIGIPSSLPKSSLWERAKSFMNNHDLFNDHPSLIKAAVEMGRTKTDESNRGKGLQDLLDFIKQYGDGYMSILSQRGLYKFECKNRKSYIKKESLNYPIMGTLIIWSVIVPEKGGNSGLQFRY
jgi:hypothetical protein